MVATRWRAVTARRGQLEANLQFRMCAAALIVIWAGSMAIAQKITTPEELDKAMKKAGPALQASGKAIGSGNYAEAAKQLAIIKQVINDSREFWVQHKKEDALEANKETIAKIEAAEKLLAAPSPDSAAATAAVKQVGAACRTCHEDYRVRDADNNWVLKPGSIGG
jgi:cytochrome c556